MGGNGTELSSIKRYDAATDTWTLVQPILLAKSAFGVCTLEGHGVTECMWLVVWVMVVKPWLLCSATMQPQTRGTQLWPPCQLLAVSIVRVPLGVRCMSWAGMTPLIKSRARVGGTIRLATSGV